MSKNFTLKDNILRNKHYSCSISLIKKKNINYQYFITTLIDQQPTFVIHTNFHAGDEYFN